MTGLWLAIIFLVWYILAMVVSEYYDGRSRIGRQWLFFISFMLSPLVGFLAALISQKR